MDEKKKGFLSKMLERADAKMKDKADKKECCCCSSDDSCCE